MAANTIRFIGGATAVKQKDTLTVGGTVETDDVFIMTLTAENGETQILSVVAGSTNTTTVAATIAAAWNASSQSLFAAITATPSSATIACEADTAGVPFYLAVSTTETGGGAADDQTFTSAATTANAGPYDFNTAANWSSGAVPGAVADSTVYIEDGTILYGLDQTGASNNLVALYITRSKIGENGSGGHAHNYLKIHSPIIDINATTGPGTASFLSPVNIDADNVQTAVTVWNSGTNSTTTEPSVRVMGSDNSNTLTVYKGIVGVAQGTGETATFATITISYIGNQSTDAAVYGGSGLTVTTIVKDGGTLILRSAATTLTQNAGTLTTYGSGTITTGNIYGGTFYGNSTGTITALNISGATVDFTRSQAARTVTTLKLDPGSTLKYDPAIVTLTNKVQPLSASGVITYTAA
jgi:hypothetical protein